MFSKITSLVLVAMIVTCRAGPVQMRQDPAVAPAPDAAPPADAAPDLAAEACATLTEGAACTSEGVTGGSESHALSFGLLRYL